MTAIRVFTDEDVYGSVAVALCRAGIEALSTPKAGRLSESDESQLDWATQQGRVIVTFNVAHFANLHATWLNNGRHHAGVIVSQQRSIGEVVRRVCHLASQLSAEMMRD